MCIERIRYGISHVWVLSTQIIDQLDSFSMNHILKKDLGRFWIPKFILLVSSFIINRYIRLWKCLFLHVYINNSCFKMVGNVAHTSVVVINTIIGGHLGFCNFYWRVSYFSLIFQISHSRQHVLRGRNGNFVTNRSPAMEIPDSGFLTVSVAAIWKWPREAHIFHC